MKRKASKKPSAPKPNADLKKLTARVAALEEQMSELTAPKAEAEPEPVNE